VLSSTQDGGLGNEGVNAGEGMAAIWNRQRWHVASLNFCSDCAYARLRFIDNILFEAVSSKLHIMIAVSVKSGAALLSQPAAMPEGEEGQQ
jgi:hypothetical protein